MTTYVIFRRYLHSLYLTKCFAKILLLNSNNDALLPLSEFRSTEWNKLHSVAQNRTVTTESN